MTVCAHLTLHRIDEGYPSEYWTGGVYRCPACGALLLFPGQIPSGIGSILRRAAELDSQVTK